MSQWSKLAQRNQRFQAPPQDLLHTFKLADDLTIPSCSDPSVPIDAPGIHLGMRDLHIRFCQQWVASNRESLSYLQEVKHFGRWVFSCNAQAETGSRTKSERDRWRRLVRRRRRCLTTSRVRESFTGLKKIVWVRRRPHQPYKEKVIQIPRWFRIHHKLC